MGKVLCITPLLLLFNLVFWSSGICMLVVGIWVRIQLYDYVDLSTDSSGVGAALLGFAFLGGLIAAISMMACCCTVRGHPALLYLYGGFLAVIVLLELAAGSTVYAYRHALIQGFDLGLNSSLNAYGDHASKSAHVDMLQRTLQCCGNRGYTDWASTNPPKEIPSSCCNVPEGECDIKNLSDIYEEGCYSRVMNFINSNIGLVSGSVVGVIFFPLLGVLLACSLANAINRNKFQQVAAKPLNVFCQK